MSHPQLAEFLPKRLLVVVCVLLTARSIPAQILDTPREQWELLRLGGSDVGYGHLHEQWITQDGQRVLRSKSETHLRVMRFGQSVSQSLRLSSTESATGELIEFSSDVGSGQTSMRTVGRVLGDKLELVVTSAGKQSRQIVAWQPTFGSPFAVEHSLRRNPPREGERREFRMIVPVYNQIARVTLEAKSQMDVELLDQQRHLREVVNRTELGNAQTVVSHMWIDESGGVLKTFVDGIGQETFIVEKQRALQSRAGDFDVGKFSTVPLETSRNILTADAVTYEARVSGGDATGLFASDARQVVQPIREGEVLIEIRGSDRPGSSDDRFSPEDLSANALIQSNDRRVTELARRAAGNETDKRQLAMKMTRFVHANMRILDTSEALASAAEVAAAMAGDCTEHAVLLTAMCRAQGIPARVAIGLVYSAELKGFGYHMWTEAWVSEGWLSLDATRRDGRVGAGHLKMAVSNLQGVSPYEAFLPVMNAMGRLTLEVQESKRDRAVLVPLP